MKIITTCEHGGNLIPGQFTGNFNDAAAELNSHLGIDFGALDAFQALSGEISDFSLYSEVSRLLVDLNRSLDSPDLFSKYTRKLPENIRKMILDEYYFPYRETVIKKMKEYLQSGEKVIHISVHSFTPVLNDQPRKNDVGLLFDPDKGEEAGFCMIWKKSMEKVMSGIMIQYNYPYQGTNDGFTKYLREMFPAGYAGIELEINQKYFSHGRMDKKITKMITKSFEMSLRTCNDPVTPFD